MTVVIERSWDTPWLEHSSNPGSPVPESAIPCQVNLASLAEATGRTRSSLSRAKTRLVKQGWLTEHPDGSLEPNKRYEQAELTPKEKGWCLDANKLRSQIRLAEQEREYRKTVPQAVPESVQESVPEQQPAPDTPKTEQDAILEPFESGDAVYIPPAVQARPAQARDVLREPPVGPGDPAKTPVYPDPADTLLVMRPGNLYTLEPKQASCPLEACSGGELGVQANVVHLVFWEHQEALSGCVLDCLHSRDRARTKLPDLLTQCLVGKIGSRLRYRPAQAAVLTRKPAWSIMREARKKARVPGQHPEALLPANIPPPHVLTGRSRATTLRFDALLTGEC